MENILIISEDGKTIIGCDKSYCGEIVIPEGIISIAPEAFINSSISKIILPHSLISINYRAFKNCTCLEEAVLNEGIEFIGPQSFEGCTSLSIINLPHSINKIGRYCEGYVFSGCISLKSIIIPEGIKEINNKTFSGCSNLQTITLPSTLESIDYGAFEGCLSLQKVIISGVCKSRCGTPHRRRGVPLFFQFRHTAVVTGNGAVF